MTGRGLLGGWWICCEILASKVRGTHPLSVFPETVNPSVNKEGGRADKGKVIGPPSFREVMRLALQTPGEVSSCI
jgi:hypothetical protein